MTKITPDMLDKNALTAAYNFFGSPTGNVPEEICAYLNALLESGKAMTDDEWFGKHLHRFLRIRLDNPAGEQNNGK